MPLITYHPKSNLKLQPESNISALENDVQKLNLKHSHVHLETIKVKRIRDIVLNPSKTSSKFMMSHKLLKSSDKRWSLQQMPVKDENEKRKRRFSCSKLTGKHEVFPPPPAFEELSGLDLSHLTAEERAAILQVAARAQQVEQVENKKLEKIQQQVESFQSHTKTFKNEKLIAPAAASQNQEKLSKKKHQAGQRSHVKNISHCLASDTKVKTEKTPIEEIKNSSKFSSFQSSITSKNEVHVQCHICAKVLEADKLNDTNSKQDTRRKSGPQEIANCSACQLPTCHKCTSSSFLAKKGELLCQRCLKQRELAARSNLWMKDKRNLYRSSSEQMTHKIQGLSSNEKALKSSLKNTERSRSLSTTSSNCSNRLSPVRTFKDFHANNDHNNYAGMSIAEELIRRNSKDEDSSSFMEHPISPSKTVTKPQNVAETFSSQVKQQKKEMGSSPGDSIQHYEKDPLVSLDIKKTPSPDNHRKDQSIPKAIDIKHFSPEKEVEKAENNYKIKGGITQEDLPNGAKSKSRISQKDCPITPKPKFEKEKLKDVEKDCLNKTDPSPKKGSQKLSKESNKNENPPIMQRGLFENKIFEDTEKDYLKKKDLSAKKYSQEFSTAKNKSEKFFSKENVLKKAEPSSVNQLSLSKLAGKELSSSSYDNSSFDSQQTAIPTSLPFVKELKKLFESNEKPLASGIKRINIDLKSFNKSKVSEKSNTDPKTELIQGLVENKARNIDEKFSDCQTKSDFFCKNSSAATIMKASSDCVTMSSISEKVRPLTSSITDVSEMTPEQRNSKIDRLHRSPLTEEKALHSKLELLSNLSPLTPKKLPRNAKSSNEAALKPNKAFTKSPEILVSSVSCVPALKRSAVMKEKTALTTENKDKFHAGSGRDVVSNDSAEQNTGGLEVIRDDDKVSCSRTTSFVSSLGESEGPAEWSVDELDDGDTLFLVTSSEKGEVTLPDGITTPNNLRSVSTDGGVYTSASSSGSVFPASQAFNDSFEIISEENDTEGDFSNLISNKEETFLPLNSGSLKRTLQFTNLKRESTGDSSIEGMLNDVKKRQHKAPTQPRNEDEKTTTTISSPTSTNSPVMVPGEALFKRTKCEVDDEIDFSDEMASNQSTGLTKSYFIQKNESNFHPKPAKHHASSPIPHSTKVCDTTPINEKTSQSSFVEDQTKLARHLPDPSNQDQVTVGSRLPNKNVNASRMVTKVPGGNKVGTRILQTPSGTRLPISPLAKNNDSPSPHKKQTNQFPFSVSAPSSGAILAVCGRSYFDSDSEEEELSDPDEEHSFLVAATTTKPVHPEEMEASGSTAAGENNSFFFRRTISTDNFEQLLLKTTETPRSARRTVSNPTRTGESKHSNALSERNFQDQPSRSDSNQFPPSYQSLPKSSTSAIKAGTEAKSSECEEPESNTYLYRSHLQNQTAKSRNHLDLFQPETNFQLKKDTAVVLSSGTLNVPQTEEVQSGIGSIARCVSCGVLAQVGGGNSSPSKTAIVQNEPAGKSTSGDSNCSFSVNSSTQVTPEKETAPLKFASIDLCQLTALIQALKSSSEVEELMKDKAWGNSKISASETKRQTSPITSEPLSTQYKTSTKTIISRDVGTETCLETDQILSPRDKILTSSMSYKNFLPSQLEPRNTYFRDAVTDVGVGTDDGDLRASRNSLHISSHPRGLSAHNNYHDQSCYTPFRERQYPCYRYAHDVMTPYSNSRKRCFGLSDLGHCDVLPSQIVPHRDYCLQRRTTIGEIEMHSNLYSNWPQSNSPSMGDGLYPTMPFVVDPSQCRARPSRTPTSDHYNRRKYNIQPHFDPYQMNASSSQMINSSPSLHPPSIPNPPIYEPVFNDQPYESNWSAAKEMKQQNAALIQPNLDPDLQFLQVQVPALTRSASVPVPNHVVVTKPPSTNPFSNTVNQQVSNVSTSRVDPNLFLPQYLPRDFRNRKDFQDLNHLPSSSGALTNHNSSHYANVATVPIPSSSVSQAYAGISSNNTLSFLQGVASQSERPNSFTSSFRSDLSESVERTRYSSWNRPSTQDSTPLRSQNQIPVYPKSDYALHRGNSSLSSSENKRGLGGRPSNQSALRPHSQRFLQTLEDLEQEEKELDMKLRYLELGRGRTTTTASYFTSSGNKALSSSSATRLQSDTQGDQSKSDASSSERPYSIPHKSDPTKTGSSSARFVPNSADGSSDKQKNYIVVNNVDQIFDEEKRRRRRKDTNLKQDAGRNVSRFGPDDRSRFWQAPQQNTYSPSSLSQPRGQPNDKNYRNQHREISDSFSSPTFRKHTKTHSEENYAKQTPNRGRIDDFCERSCAQSPNYHSQPPSASRHSCCISYSGHRKNPILSHHVHKRNSNNDCKICSAHHPSSPRCYQVNYIIQDHDEVTLPWKRVAKDQERLGPILLVDNSNQNHLVNENGMNFRPIFEPNFEAAASNNQGNIWINDDKINAKIQQKHKPKNSKKRDVTPKTKCKNYCRERAEESYYHHELNESGQDMDSSDPIEDSRNVVSDTEEYNLRKEQNIDWFDKPANETKEISTYAEFSNTPVNCRRKYEL